MVADRATCVNEDGTEVPISESSFIATYTYTMAPVTVAVTDGPPDVMKGSYKYAMTYENFGTCTNTPEDVVTAAVRYTATRAR